MRLGWLLICTRSEEVTLVSRRILSSFIEDENFTTIYTHRLISKDYTFRVLVLVAPLRYQIGPGLQAHVNEVTSSSMKRFLNWEQFRSCSQLHVY